MLASLGIWQMQRLDWKEGIIAEAAAMMAQTRCPCPQRPTRWQTAIAGHGDGAVSGARGACADLVPRGGAGLSGDRRLSDGGRAAHSGRPGLCAEDQKGTPRPPTDATVVGNLHWPDDVTASTPPYDATRAIWYGRDVAGMAALLQTEPLLIIARSDTGSGIMSQPVTTAGFRNDHLQYAMTWFSLAAVWLGMTVYLVWRIRTRTV